MEKEGYTIFTGPLKHGPKGDQAVRKAEKSGQEVQVFKKGEHANKHAPLEGQKIAKIMNDEDDHKRNIYIIKPLQFHNNCVLLSLKAAMPKDGHRNSSRISYAYPRQT